MIQFPRFIKANYFLYMYNGFVLLLAVSIISTSAPPSRPIPVKELAEHCVRFHANNNALFNDEYKVRIRYENIKNPGA